MANPLPFIRRQLSFFTSGIIDRIISRTTGRRCNFSGAVLAKLHNCEPWTDHFERSALDSMRKANELKDFKNMRILAALGAKEGASRYCVELAERVIDLLAFGEEIEIETLVFLE